MQRQDLRDVPIRIIHFTLKGSNKTALLHRFNASIRVLYDENKEHFFADLSNAIKFLINQGYQMVINI